MLRTLARGAGAALVGLALPAPGASAAPPAATVASDARRVASPDPAVVAAYTDYVALLLGLTFTPAERHAIAAQCAATWVRGDAAVMRTVQRAAGQWARLQGVPAHVRAVAAAKSRPDVLLAIAKAAREGSADDRWLLEAYYRHHPPLAPAAPGGLALTRDVVDAALDLAHFRAAEIQAQPAPPPDAATRAAAYREAARRWPTLDGARQVALARQPGEWTETREQWARMGPALRLHVRAAMGAPLTPQERAAMHQAVGLGPTGGANWGMLQNTLQHMQQNSETIMGRGTTWNPTLGRWEQHGGVVTEFDGRVRVP